MLISNQLVLGAEIVKKTRRKSGYERTDDEALVELALEMVDDVAARGHVRRDEDVGPVVGPS